MEKKTALCNPKSMTGKWKLDVSGCSENILSLSCRHAPYGDVACIDIADTQKINWFFLGVGL